MKRSIGMAVLGIWCAFSEVGYAQEMPQNLTLGEGFVNPMGFYDASPAFSWKLPVGTKAQSAYQVQVKDAVKNKILWDSAWVESDQSVFVPYARKELKSRQQIEWKARFKDQQGKESEWSEVQTCEMGLLSNEDWSAHWIRSASPFDPEVETVSWFRNEFKTARAVKQARLYATAKGAYEIFINGEKIGNEHFAPGWTAYHDRIDTMTYDVTKQIKAGKNAIGATLGTAWYAGEIWWHHDKAVKGQQPELLVQLELIYEDGSKERIVTDGQWKETGDGPILYSGIYDGEEYDARKEMAGWNRVGFDDAAWKNPLVNSELGDARLTPKSLPLVVVKQELKAVEITEPEPGRFVYDFGQNFVGKIMLKNIPVKSGQTVQARVAEMLNQDGTLYTKNYRSAKCVIKYTAADEQPFTWTQTYSFYGCRYVELSGLPKGTKPSIDWLKGLVLFSDLKPTGTFTSSHKKLHQLQSNIVWGQRGNFLEVPTDCPQRNERMGWAGDAQVFASTAMFNYDCLAFFKSWLGSMRADQMDDGRIPHVIPAIYPHGGSAGWMDAATIIPWDVYVRTGDLEILADNIEMMEKLVEYYESKITEGDKLPSKLQNFGDWLQPYAKDRKGETSSDLISAAFYVHSLDLLTKSCKATGLETKASAYGRKTREAKAAFASFYLDETGTLKNAQETQTSYVLALEFGLVPESLKKNAEERLTALVDEADGHLRTGFLGTPYLTWVLDRAGKEEVAFDLLFNETYPSWFYPINQGATTMWERWNSYSHKDGFGDAKMNSFNHYAYGAVGLWMYERVAGLAPDPKHPGYKHFYVRPLVGGPLTLAKAELDTPYGLASSAWSKEGELLRMSVTVPPNTTATIVFPSDRAPKKVSAGDHTFTVECSNL